MESTKRLFALCAILMATPLVMTSIAHAEGSAEEDTPKPVVKKRPKPKPKPAPVVTTPAAPIPYTAYGSAPALSPEMNAALTPSAPPVITPKDLPQPAETSLQPHAPLQPLPPPVAVVPAPVVAPLPVQPATTPPPPIPAPPAAAPVQPGNTQISLKCETQVLRGTRFVSQGTFFIDLFPSPVFPDEHADFKFLFVDPAHQSLIRESICLDTGCSANVTGSAYYLVNRVTRRGSALRITLDRTNGAFYAEEIENNRVTRDMHLGEKGYCVPQKLPNALF